MPAYGPTHTSTGLISTAVSAHCLSFNMDKLPVFSTSSSKSSSADTGQWTSYLPAEAEGPQKRTFLSSAFTHNRSRSADARDAPPPSYESLLAPATPKGSKSTKYRSSSCEFPRFFCDGFDDTLQGLKKPMRKESFEDALEMLRKYDTVILVDDSGSMTLPGSKKGLTRWFEVQIAFKLRV